MIPLRAVSQRFYLLLELFTCFLDLLSNNLLNVLDVRDLQSLMGVRIFGVLVITLEVRYGTPPLPSVWVVPAKRGGDGGA